MTVRWHFYLNYRLILREDIVWSLLSLEERAIIDKAVEHLRVAIQLHSIGVYAVHTTVSPIRPIVTVEMVTLRERLREREEPPEVTASILHRNILSTVKMVMKDVPFVIGVQPAADPYRAHKIVTRGSYIGRLLARLITQAFWASPWLFIIVSTIVLVRLIRFIRGD